MKAVAGKKIVYLFRRYSKAATSAGATLAFTTENERDKSKDADSTTTKDGPIRTPGSTDHEIDVTCILSKGDTMISDLEEAMDNDELIEIWEANLEEPVDDATNKFKGKYFQGYLTEIDMTSNAEDMTEVALTFGVNGNGVDGSVTVTTEQQDIAAYVFRDTTKVTA